MAAGIDWSGYLTAGGIVAGIVAIYALTQIKESTVISWIIGIVIMGVLCVSMFGTQWLRMQ